MKSWSDTESKKQTYINAADPEGQMTNGSQHSLQPPNKPPPSCRPPKPSFAPPQAPAFKFINGDLNVASKQNPLLETSGHFAYRPCTERRESPELKDTDGISL